MDGIFKVAPAFKMGEFENEKNILDFSPKGLF
jgi:hypothetical protein